MEREIKKEKGIEIEQIEPYIWEIHKHGDMRVNGRIYADAKIIDSLLEDIKIGKEWNALQQIINVASLPGIQKVSIGMPDVHPGYGFPIGGVAAFDIDEGIISMGGVGYDINCGVRTLKTPLSKDVCDKNKDILADRLFQEIPAGLGSTGKINLTINEIDEVLTKGAKFAIERGYGNEEDLNYIEENGCIDGADPSNVSIKAKQRQFKQIGTLGSGNHYLEVQYVDEIFDQNVALKYGLFKNQILISIHCGSRGLGHQIGIDYQSVLWEGSKKYGIPIKERELACVPFKSKEGQKYFSAVKCGINCAFANREVIAHLARKAFSSVFGIKAEEISTFYEVGHNTCKLEKHTIDGKEKWLIVHRKGATRGFGPWRKEIPKAYQEVGQPILVGGTMGTCSYILCGTDKGMRETFGSALHGAGRIMSRKQATKKWRGKEIIDQLQKKSIIIKGHSLDGIAEEAPSAYKDISEIVEVMDHSGIAKKVVKLLPLICIKG